MITAVDLLSPYDTILYSNKTYNVCVSGRGSGKSFQIARILLIKALQERCTILCCRYIQRSINDSVHSLLSDQINKLGFQNYFKITQNKITCVNGSEFIFKGLYTNLSDMKSLDQCKYVWVEEAEAISQLAWDVLIPTIIRNEGAKFYISFNPRFEEDATYQMFVASERDDTLVVRGSYLDNPMLSAEFIKEAESLKNLDYDRYSYIYLGKFLQHSQSQIFYGKYVVEDFDVEELEHNYKQYRGLDFGWNDTQVYVECYIKDNKLYIAREMAETKQDLDSLTSFLQSVNNNSTIYADNSRPEIINHLTSRGINIQGCTKFSGIEKEAISKMRLFDKIVIHSSCKQSSFDFSRYKWKEDKNTGKILDIIDDKYHQNAIDAVRYAVQDQLFNKTVTVTVNPFSRSQK